MCLSVFQVQHSNHQIFISIRGNREVGVVKWVKESYGFIQSASHAEDLFYHGSEVSTNNCSPINAAQ